jgi:hypothetical protein
MSDSNPASAWVRTAMRCSYCKRPAGLLRRICVKCARVVAIVDRAAGRVGWTELVDLFAAEGLKREDVDTVLDAEVAGAPTMRDRLTSRMANELMRNLGMPGRQSPEDVQRIRSAAAAGEGEGTWKAGEKPPEVS